MERSRGTLWTIGHSNRPWQEFAQLLREAGIEWLVDVRRFAGSRHNPQYAAQALPGALAAVGIGYRALPGMGGRRRVQDDSPNLGWRVAAFRAYADHLASEDYRQARTELMALASAQRCCVMCAEAVWWRCHRRIVADYLLLAGREVLHLMGENRIEPARMTEAAVPADDGIHYPLPLLPP